MNQLNKNPNIALLETSYQLWQVGRRARVRHCPSLTHMTVNDTLTASACGGWVDGSVVCTVLQYGGGPGLGKKNIVVINLTDDLKCIQCHAAAMTRYAPTVSCQIHHNKVLFSKARGGRQDGRWRKKGEIQKNRCPQAAERVRKVSAWRESRRGRERGRERGEGQGGPIKRLRKGLGSSIKGLHHCSSSRRLFVR